MMDTANTTNMGARVLVQRAVFFILLFAAAGFPDNVISQIGWKGAGPGVVVGVVVFFGTGIGLLVSFYIGSRRNHGKIEQELSAKLFSEGCERSRLTREEVNVLLGMVAFAPDPPTKGHLIFESLPLYERCLDAYIGRTLRLQTSVGRIEEQDDILLRLRKKMGYAVLAPEQPLASTRNLSVGQKVSVFVPGQKSESFGAIVSHVGEFWFTVRITEDFGGGVNLGGSEKVVAFLRQGDAAYSVTVKVREFLSVGEICFFHAITLLRNQNRQYMRLDISLAVKYRILERAGAEERPSNEFFNARTVDISGGGICLVTEEPLMAGDVISLTINIPSYTLNGIRSKVLKVITAESRTSTHYRHLVQFVGIEPQQRERIVKFVFVKYRAMLQTR
jgi:c-di-GMP-binding flagellar brake protein YcgR